MASEKANYESSYRITPLSSTGSARVDVAKGDPITDTPSSKEEPTPAENDEKQYPEGFKLVLLTMALMLAIFMIALDTNIVGKHNDFSVDTTTFRLSTNPRERFYICININILSTYLHQEPPSPK